METIHNYLKLSDTWSTGGQPSEAQLKQIAEAGFEVVINLGLHDAEYSLKDEQSTVNKLGMDYIHIPVEWEKPTAERLLSFFIALQQNSDRPIFIHCAANMRVSIFVALFRVITQSWTPQEAMRDVVQIWEPNQVWKRFYDSMLDRGAGGLSGLLEA